MSQWKFSPGKYEIDVKIASSWTIINGSLNERKFLI